MFLRLLSIATFFAMMASAVAQPSRMTVVHNDVDSIRDFSGDAMLAMYVTVKGDVVTPGRYRVASSTKLAQLIAYAGGPTKKARLKDVRIVHDLTMDSTITEPVVFFNLELYQRTGDPSLNPILTANDTIIIADESDPRTDVQPSH